MKKKKKRILGVVIFLACVSLITLLAPYKRQEIVKGDITVWTSNETYGYFQKIADEFKKSNKRVNIDIINIDKKNYIKEIVNSEYNKLPNIALFDFIEIEKLKDKIVMADGNKEIIETYSNNFHKNRLQQVIVDEDYYGIPFTSRPIALYIREDIIKEYGYDIEDINTWKDILNIGTEIYNKTNGEIRIFSYKDMKDISLLLTAQMISDKSKNNKDIIIKELNDLYNSELVSKYGDSNYLASISSHEMLKVISESDQNVKWICKTPPSINPGENKFYDIGGKSLVVLKRDNSNNEAIKKFIAYSANNKEILGEELRKNNFIPSSVYAYSNKVTKKDIENIENSSPLLILCNIVERAPKIENYDLYKNIIQEIYSSNFEIDS
ncbi:hypothetical protein JCM1393_16510 [Clostridium carnis]